MNLHLFKDFLSTLCTYNLKNIMCVLQSGGVIGMKMFELQCTVSMLVLLSFSHTFVREK